MTHIILTSIPHGDVAARWNAFLADAECATHYVTPNYFSDPYLRSERFAILAVETDGQIAAVLTGVSENARIVSGLFSRPQLAFRSGINRGVALQSLRDGLFRISDNPESIELYTWQKMPELTHYGMQMRPSSNATSVVVLDLSIGRDAIFAGFSQTRRSELRKAVKQGLVEIKELETESELSELYEIHLDWTAKKGLTPDTFEQMKAAASQKENRRILIAKTEGKVIAGSFYRFASGGMVEYAGNCSRPEYQKLRPNDLLCWRAIEWACDSGFSHFSMGGSHLFLRRFGGSVQTTYRYKWVQNRFAFEHLRERTLEIGSETYRRLPDSVRSGVRRVLAR